MAEEVDSLFVSLGLATDEESFQEADNMFAGLRRTALQFGAAIGTGMGLQEMTFGFAEANRELARFAELFSADPQFVDNLRFAFESITGSADGAFGAISKVADIIEQTDWGEIPSDAFREVGFDPMLLQGVDSMAGAFERLAGATDDMDPETARRALSNLGFGDQEIQVLRAQGEESLERLLARGEQLRDVSEDQLEASKEFNRATSELSRVIQDLLDDWSLEAIRGVTEQMELLTEVLEDNKEELKSSVDATRELSGWAQWLLSWLPGPLGDMAESAESPMEAFERRSGEEAPTPIGDFFSGWFEGSSGGSSPEQTRFVARQERMRVEQIETLRRTDPANSELPRLQSDLFGLRTTLANAGGIPTVGGMGGVSVERINVDARGASDPGDMERRIKRGVRDGINEAAENTIQDNAGGPQ